MSDWHCLVGGRQHGPMSEQELRQWIAQGRLSANDYVWQAGMKDWALAGTLPGLLQTGVFVPLPPGALMPVCSPGGTGGASSTGEITAKARCALHGRWGLAIGFSVLLFLLEIAANMVPYVNWITSLIMGGPLVLGWSIFFLTYTRRGPADLGMLFAGFKRFGKALALYIVRSLLITAWAALSALPGVVVLLIFLFMSHSETAIFAVMPLIFIPVMIVSLIFQLSYSQAFFVLADDPSVGILQSIWRSRDIMKGHKGRLLVLWLRFTGWALLCILTLGVGFLWLSPYISASTAIFYDDLKPPSVAGAVAPTYMTEGPASTATLAC